jgi:hypothetical protein
MSREMKLFHDIWRMKFSYQQWILNVSKVRCYLLHDEISSLLFILVLLLSFCSRYFLIYIFNQTENWEDSTFIYVSWYNFLVILFSHFQYEKCVLHRNYTTPPLILLIDNGGKGIKGWFTWQESIKVS